MPGDEITTGELARRIDRVEKQLAEGFRAINLTIAAQQFIHVDRYNADREAFDRRIAQLEDRSTWLSRTVGATLFMAVVSVALTFLVARGGL
jgi:hypothetical protein